MSDRQYYGKEAEKAEKEREKHEKEGRSWEEKWRHDPVSGAVWALILVWAGLVLLADNMGLFTPYERLDDIWGLILAGAGMLVILGAIVRLIVPVYRRAIGGALIWGAILVAVGLGNLLGVSIAWPLILIAIGIGLLLRGLLGSR